MDILKPNAVIGTNSWGSSGYEKVIRGSAVGMENFRATVQAAKACDLALFDTARDYGLGKCAKILGEIGTQDIYVSAKYTPVLRYKKGQVIKSFEKDLADMKRDYIDIYWLHMPNDIEENLREIIALYREGKIRYVGVSNFNLRECCLAKSILDRAGIPLYGVQNHYSILCREWEQNGLLQWCKDNGVQFWAWASLEEGLLAGPVKLSGVVGLASINKTKKYAPLYAVMEKIGKIHNFSISQVAISYCVTKGVVPMCGCRKPNRVEELAKGASECLTQAEITMIEQVVKKHQLKNFGADIFRFAVRRKQ